MNLNEANKIWIFKHFHCLGHSYVPPQPLLLIRYSIYVVVHLYLFRPALMALFLAKKLLH